MKNLQLDNRSGFPVLLSFKQIDIFSVNASIVTDEPVEIGDKVKRKFINREFETCYFDGEVEAIVEARPARGAWDPKKRPDFYELILNGTIRRQKDDKPQLKTK